jgi:hypothetical protein
MLQPLRHIARRAGGRHNRSSAYHAGVYWASNIVAHREIHRKQGLKLGDGTKLKTDDHK